MRFALAATLFALALTACLSGDDGKTGVEGGDTLVGGFLRTANRTELAICVDVIDQDASWIPAATDALGQAWPTIASHKAWESFRVSYPDPVVDTDCPGQPLALQGGLQPEVEFASPYLVHVYVVDAAADFMDEDGVRIWPEQALCDQDDRVEVTTGLYITPDVLGEPALVSGYLAKSLGLERGGPVVLPETTTPATSMP